LDPPPLPPALVTRLDEIADELTHRGCVRSSATDPDRYQLAFDWSPLRIERQ